MERRTPARGPSPATRIAVVAETGAPTTLRRVPPDHLGVLRRRALANLTTVTATHQMKDLLALPFDKRLLDTDGK